MASQDEKAIEGEIQAKGLNAPRLTPEMIDATIQHEQFHVPPGTTLTICILTLRNGFTVTGESAAASPQNFDREIGEKIARENARAKIWALEGYRLRQALHAGGYGANYSKVIIAARLSHEVNRIWCEMNGDFSQPSWPDAPGWQRRSAIAGVEFHAKNPDAGPEASHESWRAEKLADGWKWGPVKNPEAKEHPCMCDFDQLPLHQQIKDRLFKSVVHSILGA